jgi:hypothetical protein
MQNRLEELNTSIKIQLDKVAGRYPTTQFIQKYDGSQITLHVIFDKVNQLGDWFVCTVQEKRFPLNNEIIGITIDYFDSNNYVHYFLEDMKNEFDYLKTIKMLAIIMGEFRAGELFLRGSKFHIQYTSDQNE